MQEKYEQAIKETFEYLEEYLKEQDKLNPLMRLQSLGVDKRYVIESQMKERGFNVKCRYNKACISIAIYPEQDNLPIHIWREK
jgi:hypothetical protein